MYFAIIDLGTASLRAAVFRPYETSYPAAQTAPALPLERVYHKSFMPRLGSEMYRSSRLSADGRRETLAAFEQIKDELSIYPGLVLSAAATSALREASDGAQFIKEISEKFSIPIQIVTGEREAELCAKGILAFDTLPNENMALIDVGGGSTEISLVELGVIVHSESLPLGAIRCMEDTLKCLPPSPSDVLALRSSVSSKLRPLEAYRGKISLAVGSSGAARTLCRLFGCEFGKESLISQQQISNFTRSLIPLSLAETLELHKVEKRRADIVLSGALIIDEFLAFFEIPKFRASRYSLRHGLLAEAYSQRTTEKLL